MFSAVQSLRKVIPHQLLLRPLKWPSCNQLPLPKVAAIAGCRHCSSNGDSTKSIDSKQDRDLSHTSVFVQDGVRIEELPCIVRVVQGEFTVHDNIKTNNGTRVRGLGIQAVPTSTTTAKKTNTIEEEAMVGGFGKCSSLSELCFLLCQCPDEEVTPPVALAIIKNMIQLENNRKFRNPSDTFLREQAEADQMFMGEYKSGMGPIPENFTRAAIMERLFKSVCKASDPQTILDAVKVLRKDTSDGDKTPYLKLLCDECLLLVSESKLSVSQVTSLAQDLYLLNSSFTKPYSEKLWSGLEKYVPNIDEDGLSELFSMLPYINQSRQYVFYMAEKRALSIWYKLSVDHVIQIVSILVTCQCNSRMLLGALSRWTNVNIHTLTEGNLRWIMLSFTKLCYIDYSLERALTRYTKAKQSMIQDPALVSAIMDYCLTLRYRSPQILEACSSFFIKEHNSLSIPDIWTICYTFGELNYLPSNSSKFFNVLENLLENKFPEFPPDLFVDLLLMCVYLKRYPLNFTKMVYHPFFFQRIYQLKPVDAACTRAKLGVLDHAMKLEASGYPGPMVSKIFPGAYTWMHSDKRLLQCIDRNKDVFIEIAGDPKRVLISYEMKGFPTTNLYKVDCLINTNVNSSVKSLLPANSLGHRFALVVQMLEHYDMMRQHLLGPQALRERHFKLSGLTVVNLDYDTLVRYKNIPIKRKEHVLEKLTEAVSRHDD